MRVNAESLYRTPKGTVCFHDTDFKYASFEGEITEPVKDFLLANYKEFSKEQQECIRRKFWIQYGKQKADELISLAKA